MNKYYDYCNAYDTYNSQKMFDNSNNIKTFSCSVCKQSKLILKKSVSDPVFKCEECLGEILNSKQALHQNQETTKKWFNFFI